MKVLKQNVTGNKVDLEDKFCDEWEDGYLYRGSFYIIEIAIKTNSLHSFSNILTLK